MTGRDAELLEQAEILAAKVDSRILFRSWLIAPLAKSNAELAHRLVLALAVVEAAPPFVSHDAPGSRKQLREALAAFEADAA